MAAIFRLAPYASQQTTGGRGARYRPGERGRALGVRGDPRPRTPLMRRRAGAAGARAREPRARRLHVAVGFEDGPGAVLRGEELMEVG